MFREPPLSETLQYLTLNIISAFLCAAAHNALYFMLGLSNWAFHFMHYFFTFIMLLASYFCGLIPKKKIPLREIWPIALTQVGVTVATGIIHYGGKEGALYTLRLTDFAVTIIVIHIARRFVDPACQPSLKRKPLMIFIAVTASLAWLEFGILDNDIFAILATPLLVISTALHFLVTFQKQQKLQVHTDLLTLYTTGLTSALLLLPAIIFTSDSFNKEMLGTASSWELIDYALLSMAVVFMIGLIYSKYWLMCNCAPETYLYMRHFKYTLASFGQWFTQNMAHVTVFSVAGKVMASGAGIYYAWLRYTEYRSTQKYGAMGSGSVGKI